MVFEIQLVEGCRHSVMDSAGCERSRCGYITVQGRSIHLELRRNVLPRRFIRAQQRANGFQLLRA
jgi:hypothetical protein